jgi:circadian clock protein KaiB
MMTSYTFKLFLYLTAPEHPETAESIQILKEFLTEKFPRSFELQIVNVLKNPELATKENVFATPTLIREAPPPPLRVVGDFTDRERVLAALELE